jgi:hypothetical protein
MGADQTGRSRVPFAQYKGEAEKALLAAGFPRLYIFRPAYIYPVKPRSEPNFSYRLLRAIYPVFRRLFPNQVIPADDLARAMVDVGVRKTAERANRYVPLAVAVLAPVIVNILSFHALMAPSGLPLALFVAALWAVIFVDVRPAFAGLFQARLQPRA